MSTLSSIGSRAASVRSCHKKKSAASSYCSIGSGRHTPSPKVLTPTSRRSSTAALHSSDRVIGSYDSVHNSKTYRNSGGVVNRPLKKVCSRKYSKKSVRKPNKIFENFNDKKSVPKLSVSQTKSRLLVPPDDNNYYQRNSRSAPTSPFRSKPVYDYYDNASLNIPLSTSQQNFSELFPFEFNCASWSSTTSEEDEGLVHKEKCSSPSDKPTITWESEKEQQRALADPWFLTNNSDCFSTTSSFVYSLPARYTHNNSGSYSPSTISESLSSPENITVSPSVEDLAEDCGSSTRANSSTTASLASFYGLSEFYHQVFFNSDIKSRYYLFTGITTSFELSNISNIF